MEQLKKKLELEHSKDNLCTISKKNLIVCNEVSTFCQKYTVEYNEEINELRDVIVLFKSYIDKCDE